MSDDLNREFPPIFDGHEDFLTQMRARGGGQLFATVRRDFLTESEEGHVDLPRAMRGGLGGTFTSIWLTGQQAEMNPVGHAIDEINDLLRISDRSEGRVRICRGVDEVTSAFEAGAFASVIAFEGADPISASLKELRVFYEAGLRCLALAWSRDTIFASGVRFRGEQRTVGLTDAGRELVTECNRLGIVLDVSHLNVPGFWDLLEASEDPVIATHSSVQAIAPHVRNLDDEQIRALAAQGGTMGINFANSFLRPDMKSDDDTPLEVVLDHFDHVVNLVGDEHVSFGTDFDGTSVPAVLNDASKLPEVLRGLKARGYSDDRLERICHANFLRVVGEVWR